MSDPDVEPGILAVPSALVLPDAARDRLRRRFEHERPAVGVVAPISALPAGSSVTTAAERAAMAPMAACTTTRDREVHGAVLLAPGVAHRVDDRTVTIEAEEAEAGLLVDPGAASFDPDATDATPAPIADDARPPFRWRPLVLFLAGGDDAHLAQLAATLADRLLDHDVEPRLAVHGALDGPLRIRPVPPEASLVGALRADIVVALDAEAAALAERAPGAPRSTVVVLLDEALGDGIELVPWTIGSASGRLRARVGPRADPGAVTALINRLCSGPLPEPPADPPATDLPGDRSADDLDPSTPVALAAPRAREPDAARIPAPVVQVLAPAASDADDAGAMIDPTGRVARAWAARRPLLAGLVDHLLAAGWVLGSASPTGRDGSPDTRRPDDLVLVAGGLDPARPEPVGRIVHVVEDLDDARAVVDHGHDGSGSATLTIAPGRDVTAPLQAAGVDAISVATLRTRADLQARTDAAEHRVRPAAPTIAVVGDGGGWAGPEAASVRRAIEQVRRDHGDLDVVVVDPADGGRDRAAVGTARVRAGLDDAGEVAGWTAAVWLGEPAGAGAVPSGTTTLATLALSGVPVVIAAEHAPGLGALVDPSLAVTDAGSSDQWAGHLLHLLDDDLRSIASARARRIGAAIEGEEAAASVVQRILGWLAGADR